MLSDKLHEEFLTAVLAKDTNFMISTRPNELYDIMLKTWRKKTMITRDRRGNATEVVYMNYEPPKLLHQYDMLGDDYVERQHLNRVRTRFANKLSRVDEYTRHMMIEEMIKNDPAAVQHFMAVLAGKKNSGNDVEIRVQPPTRFV